MILTGLGSIALAVLVFIESQNLIWTALFGIFGIAVLLVGIFGKRKKVDTVLDGLDSAVSSNIIDSIF